MERAPYGSLIDLLGEGMLVEKRELVCEITFRLTCPLNCRKQGLCIWCL